MRAKCAKMSEISKKQRLDRKLAGNEIIVQDMTEEEYSSLMNESVLLQTEVLYSVIAGAASTTRTQFTHINTACEQCDEAESVTRKFERCERCNIVYHRTCLQPQIQLPPG